MEVILASASPRRRELLKQIILQFKVVPAAGEERIDAALPPEKIACALARAKCREVSEKYPDGLVIGCDTIVVYGGRILGKPKDGQDAVQTLRMLSGKTHSVITGVCVRTPQTEIEDFAVTEVTFNALSAEFIEKYVAGGSPMDKAGSYGTQDGGVVKSFHGSYTNVVGLPVELLRKILKEVM